MNSLDNKFGIPHVPEVSYKHNPTISITDSVPECNWELFEDKTTYDEPKHPSLEPAVGFLGEAQEQMNARAKLRDTPGGERTAKKIAEVFNAITGHNLTEEDSWTFLIVLKMVRARAGKYNRDDFVDLAAYSSLMGESASKRKGQ